MLRVNIIGQILVVFGLYHQITKIFCQENQVFFRGWGCKMLLFVGYFQLFLAHNVNLRSRM